MVPQWIIEKKRDGGELSAEEIRDFIAGFTDGSIPDYQMAALAMAIYLRGMTPRETADLTLAMMHSGDVFDTSSVALPKSDKHSTGGIGDKVSLILAPLAACCGVAVPMVSGRGLGITGGTLDKLESIRGFNVRLPEAEFLAVLRRHGCAMIGQTDRLAPADRNLYALRDVTATVPSIPLITASIMCKKLAEGIDALVLDVKWGRGAFMQTLDQARALARSMVAVGKAMGKKVTALLTPMNQPLGRACGNALEVAESVDCLRGRGPADLMEVTLALTAEMLVLPGVEPDTASALRRLHAALDSGEAFRRFRDMTATQGGDVTMLDDPAKLPQASIQRPFPAPSSGFVTRADADALGRGILLLGGGRMKTTDTIEPSVGISALAKQGENVEKGAPLMIIHAADETRFNAAMDWFGKAFTIGSAAPLPEPAVTERIGMEDVPA